MGRSAAVYDNPIERDLIVERRSRPNVEPKRQRDLHEPVTNSQSSMYTIVIDVYIYRRHVSCRLLCMYACTTFYDPCIVTSRSIDSSMTDIPRSLICFLFHNLFFFLGILPSTLKQTRAIKTTCFISPRDRSFVPRAIRAQGGSIALEMTLVLAANDARVVELPREYLLQPIDPRLVRLRLSAEPNLHSVTTCSSASNSSADHARRFRGGARINLEDGANEKDW